MRERARSINNTTDFLITPKMYAPLETSLVLRKGTGDPTWSRATKAWGFNELGYLEELASGCAFFGGARLVRNTVRTKSEDFSNAAWVKTNLTVTGTNVLVCSNSTADNSVNQATDTSVPTIAGQYFRYSIRVRRVSGGVSFVQIGGSSTSFGATAFCTFSLIDGTYAAQAGVTVSVTQISSDTYDFSVRLLCTTTTTGSDVFYVSMQNGLSDTRKQSFIGDGIKSFELLRAWSVDVTNYDASYVPEYVSVGVVPSPFFGAGIDGAKYFSTDYTGGRALTNLIGFRREAAATNNLLYGRDLTVQAITATTKRWDVSGTSGLELVTNGTFTADLSNWTAIVGSGGSITATGGICTFVSDGSGFTSITNSATLTVGKTYVVTVVASGTGSLKFVSTMLAFTNIGNGTSTFSFVATGTSIALARTAGVACNLDIDSISIKEAAVQCALVTGLDGIADTATTLTAAAADAIILQPTSGIASAARCASAYVKRRTGTGTISFTQDGGSTWTDITSQINSSTWSRVQITATLANPSVGFKISTSGDAIDVDCVQNEAGAVATSPIVTTTAAVTRDADSLTYQTSGNWSDTVGTAYVEVEPLAYSGGAIGSATNGLLLSTSNSGATAFDGTNAANGPTGTPGTSEKLALNWTGAVMEVASSATVGTPGTYDGAMGLSNIGIGVGASGYFKNVAVYPYALSDADMVKITT